MPCPRIGWVDLQSSLILEKRLTGTTRLEQGFPKGVVRLPVRGIDAQGFPVFRDGLLVPPLQEECVAQIVAPGGIVRPQLHRLTVRGLSLPVPPKIQQRVAEVVVCIGITGFHQKGAAAHGLGLLGMTLQ